VASSVLLEHRPREGFTCTTTLAQIHTRTLYHSHTHPQVPTKAASKYQRLSPYLAHLLRYFGATVQHPPFYPFSRPCLTCSALLISFSFRSPPPPSPSPSPFLF
jgi:hypothetical protein